MTGRKQLIMNKSRGQLYSLKETTKVGDTIYDLEKLKRYANRLEIKSVELSILKNNLKKGNYFWIDRNGKKLGPAQILENWETAQKNPAWLDHIESIKRADLRDPLFVTSDGFVFDGVHRLTRAFLQGRKTVKVKIFDQLPKSAAIRKIKSDFNG